MHFAHRVAQSKAMQATFVMDEAKPRKKARLSWYHPDDTVRTRLLQRSRHTSSASCC